MKAVIFAGGVGTRLWPLSRKRSPKQFEKVVGEKSTLQIAVEKLHGLFDWQDIFIATQRQYRKHVFEQLPDLPKENVIGEPERRDVGPAVGLALAHIKKRFHDTPMVILWSDHLVKNEKRFIYVLKQANEYINSHKDTIILISQKPRFASQNLGWVQFGEIIGRKGEVNFHAFKKFHYRPTLSQAHSFIKEGNFAWNVGYFVVRTSYLWNLYRSLQPRLFEGMQKIYDSIGTKRYNQVIKKVYPALSQISFDSAILEKMETSHAVVVSEDVGWSDIGAWEALKEALQVKPSQNVTSGKVLVTDCKDSLIYNYSDQLVVTIDLDGHLVVNTKDVILVCHKNSVPKIKKLVENLSLSKDNHLV